MDDLPPISAHGKQLLQAGRHLADCRSNEAAAAMALLLNRAALILPTDAEVRIVRAGLAGLALAQLMMLRGEDEPLDLPAQIEEVPPPDGVPVEVWREMQQILHETIAYMSGAYDGRKDMEAQLAEAQREIARLRDALAATEGAISEYYRYWTGGETRGSYDGKPERAGLWKAQQIARAALKGGAK